MQPVLVLRIMLYIQFVLGLIASAAEFGGMQVNRGVFDFHGLLGILIAIVAIAVLRPVSGVPNSGIRTVARFFPLVPLVVGLGFMFHIIGGHGLIGIHMLLGIITIGLVEAASAQQRRALRGLKA
ncbi:MAG TPA: hypothetical protein VMW65_11945 [Chloroflexota bacterium]|nr:hypothetical protein [Chloroflexota bacterium]